jgi:hypothetical protein
MALGRGGMLVVTETLPKHLTPNRVRAVAEEALESQHREWCDVTFVARVRNSDEDVENSCEEWLLAIGSDQVVPGSRITADGEWLMTSQEFWYGAKEERPPLWVTTADHVKVASE